MNDFFKTHGYAEDDPIPAFDDLSLPPKPPFLFIRLDGPPRGKGRPRTRVIGTFATIFTDKETRAYENALKAAGIEAMEAAALEPIDEPLAVVIVAHLPIPQSWSVKKRAAALSGEIFPTTKPDLDNICKMLDGLNYDDEKRPIVWRDDSLIVSMQAMKVYSLHPRLEITVWRWNA